MMSSEEAQLRSRFNRLLLNLLPVRGFGELLSSLAGLWCELCEAPAVVSARLPTGNRLSAGFAAPGGTASFVEWPVTPAEVWNAGDVLSALAAQPELPDLTDRRTEAIPFCGDGLSQGGVILFPELKQTLSAELFPEWRQFSGLLVEQAALQEADGIASDTEARLQAAKLESLAEFAAGAGHEINNPLATISGRVQLLLRGERDPQRRQALTTIGAQALRIRDMIGDLMLFARPPQPACEVLDLSEVVRSALEPLRERAEICGCTFEVQAGEPVAVWADRTQVAVVVGSLVGNSIEALAEGGPIRIRTESIMEENRPSGLLTVIDDGPGLHPMQREHLFDPFYSGREAGRGLGFGLSKCWRIVSNHGGRIEVDSVPAQSTVFRVYWLGEQPDDNAEAD